MLKIDGLKYKGGVFVINFLVCIPYVYYLCNDLKRSRV